MPIIRRWNLGYLFVNTTVTHGSQNLRAAWPVRPARSHHYVWWTAKQSFPKTGLGKIQLDYCVSQIC